MRTSGNVGVCRGVDRAVGGRGIPAARGSPRLRVLRDGRTVRRCVGRGARNRGGAPRALPGRRRRRPGTLARRNRGGCRACDSRRHHPPERAAQAGLRSRRWARAVPRPSRPIGTLGRHARRRLWIRGSPPRRLDRRGHLRGDPARRALAASARATGIRLRSPGRHVPRTDLRRGHPPHAGPVGLPRGDGALRLGVRRDRAPGGSRTQAPRRNGAACALRKLRAAPLLASGALPLESERRGRRCRSGRNAAHEASGDPLSGRETGGRTASARARRRGVLARGARVRRTPARYAAGARLSLPRSGGEAAPHRRRGDELYQALAAADPQARAGARRVRRDRARTVRRTRRCLAAHGAGRRRRRGRGLAGRRVHRARGSARTARPEALARPAAVVRSRALLRGSGASGVHGGRVRDPLPLAVARAGGVSRRIRQRIARRRGAGCFVLVVPRYAARERARHRARAAALCIDRHRAPHVSARSRRTAA